MYCILKNHILNLNNSIASYKKGLSQYFIKNVICLLFFEITVYCVYYIICFKVITVSYMIKLSFLLFNAIN